MKWINRWFSFSWKKFVLAAALVLIMWFVNRMSFSKVDGFSRDALQFLNDNKNVEKSIVTINMNLKHEIFKRPFTFDTLKQVIDKILAQNPKNFILSISPLEIDGDEESVDFRKDLFDYLVTKKNVYVYSNGFSDKNDLNTDEYFKKFPRILRITMIYDDHPSRGKHRRAIVTYDKIGEAGEFKEVQKLGYETKTSADFSYGWKYWGTTQPYIKTHSLDTFGAHDAHELLQSNFEEVSLKDKTVILGTADEFSMLSTESIFNLFWPTGTPGYKDFPAPDSLANYLNFFIHGDYIKLIQNFNDVFWMTIFLVILIFAKIKMKIKLFIFISIIPILAIVNVFIYVAASFYINFARSITAIFFLQYFGIPVIMFSMFKEQESKKLQEINDARIDALLSVSEKVAHDIRSPLSAINLVGAKVTFPDTEYKEIFDGAVQRIDETATKILTRYRTKTGQENEKPEKFDLSEIANDIVKEKKILNAAIDFEIVTNAESSFAMGYKLDLERIISNILDNSIFALKNIIDPKVFIAIHENDQMIQLMVTDNGTGIPEQVLKVVGNERITTKADTNQGNGIGLLHAKRLIERLNGKFEITSQEHVGTTIKISLPKA